MYTIFRRSRIATIYQQKYVPEKYEKWELNQKRVPKSRSNLGHMWRHADGLGWAFMVVISSEKLKGLFCTIIIIIVNIATNILC
jgi:hypothetical protein